MGHHIHKTLEHQNGERQEMQASLAVATITS
jgi:hypothetical protein